MSVRACVVCGRPTESANQSRCARHRQPSPRVRWYRDLCDRIMAVSSLCGICGQPLGDKSDAVIDHIVPRALGGTHDESNLQAAHRSCNGRKSATLAGRRHRRRRPLAT